MKKIHFRLGTFGRWAKPVIQMSISGTVWNRWCNINELEYWLSYYKNDGYEIIF